MIKSIKNKLFSIVTARRLIKQNAPRSIAAAPNAKNRLFIAPANSAGQGWQWARAAEQKIPETKAVAMQFVDGLETFGYQIDEAVHSGIGAHSKTWQKEQLEALKKFNFVIVESALPIFGGLFESNPEKQISELRRAGTKVALLFHGSDLREPDAHMLEEKDSYFKVNESFTALMRTKTKQSRNLITLGLPIFVSTPDLLFEKLTSDGVAKDKVQAQRQPVAQCLPAVQWLPVVVDTKLWATETKPLTGERKPRVIHAPSKGFIKGSDLIDPILQDLHDKNVIEYVRVSGISHKEMVETYKSADIIVDQLRGGPYGVAACEAMATGRIVISHVPQKIRDKVKTITGQEIPIIEADKTTLKKVITDILNDKEKAQKEAARGPKFVQKVHDGKMSAQVLQNWFEGKTL